LLPVEAANVLRMAELSGDIAPEVASLAYGDLLALRVQMVPYEPFASRVWELRHSVAAYDAWYVAIAERFDLRLATLDRRLARAAGPRCRFLAP
jgi:predicted nucleic acid-binding protein